MKDPMADWAAKHPPGTEVLAAIYARRSKGRDETTSPQEQIEKCQALCAARGWTVRFRIVEDDAKADYHLRPRWLLLLMLARRRRFHVLVSWKNDRWTRSLWDTMRTQRMLAKCGIAYVSIMEPYDTTTPHGRFSTQILGSVAELERANISQRCKLGWDNFARNLKWPNKRPPLGYRRNEDKTLSIEPAEVPLVNRIWNLYAETRSTVKVADTLNEDGENTRLGRPFTARAVRSVLTNTILKGRWDRNGIRRSVEHLRLRTDDDFDHAQLVLHRPVKEPTTTPMPRKLAAWDRMVAAYVDELAQQESDEDAAHRLDRRADLREHLRATLAGGLDPVLVARVVGTQREDALWRRQLADVVTEEPDAVVPGPPVWTATPTRPPDGRWPNGEASVGRDAPEPRGRRAQAVPPSR